MVETTSSHVLVLQAHADDCAWTTAGTVARLIQDGKTVDDVLFTDSNFEGNGEERRKEEMAAMAILGMRTLFPVGYDRGLKDGHLNLTSYSEMVQALCDIIDKADQTDSPYDQIVTFGMDGFSGHSDHIMVASVANYVFHTLRRGKALSKLWMVGMSEEERKAWPPDYFVYIPSVNTRDYTPVDISTTLPLKIGAIQAHTSQLHNGAVAHMERVKTLLPPKEFFQMVNRV